MHIETSQTYTQVFDTQNRLTSVTVSPSGQTTTFAYDPDGNLVKKINPDGSKTIYVGGVYEENKASGGTVTGTKTYYPAAGAMRVTPPINGKDLFYILKDHLGSASILTDDSGVPVTDANVRYFPFGEARPSNPNLGTAPMLTDKLFTSQRLMTDLGIYHYGARFYSPRLGRFLSADTVVPGYANPQSLNRYSYVGNNPLRYIDPTGHRACDDIDEAGRCITAAGGGGMGFGGSQPTADDDEEETDPLADAIQSAFEYCPFGWVCNDIHDVFWEQLANWLLPAYTSGSKNELYVMYTLMAGGARGITLVTTPDGRFVVYDEYSEIGKTFTNYPNFTVNSSKGIISGMVNPTDYEGLAITGSISAGLLSGGGWTTPGGELGGLDVTASVGASLPVGGTVSVTQADPIAHGQYEGFMLFFCRAVLGGCGR